jgi:hypothetical protein
LFKVDSNEHVTSVFPILDDGSSDEVADEGAPEMPPGGDADASEPPAPAPEPSEPDDA